MKILILQRVSLLLLLLATPFVGSQLFSDDCWEITAGICDEVANYDCNGEPCDPEYMFCQDSTVPSGNSYMYASQAPGEGTTDTWRSEETIVECWVTTPCFCVTDLDTGVTSCSSYGSDPISVGFGWLYPNGSVCNGSDGGGDGGGDGN